MRPPLPYDLDQVRAEFPALLRHHHGHPVAYFDGPGGTQVPRTVGDAVLDYLHHHNANTHWSYPTSQETDALIAAARQALADFLGAAPTEVAFGANMTTLTFHLARAIGRGLGPGDEIVITELDHHANIAPWQAVERERGVTLRVVRFDPESGELDWESLQAAVGGRTRVVAVGAASNALGTVNEVSRAAELAHAVGAVCFVDAVHWAAHGRIDVRTIGCDALACSSYKFYGPHLGILFGTESFLAGLDLPKLTPAPDTVPERMETGTQNHEGIVGAAAAVDFLAGLGQGQGTGRSARLDDAIARLHAHGQGLVERLWEGLGQIPSVRRYGPPPTRPRTPTVAFTVAGYPAEQVARRLAERGVFVSHGDFYATTVVERLGCAAEGVVRVGCACYTTPQEVDRLLEGVAALADRPPVVPVLR
jgi:cysteine desulfurase family protein (TIGR01976 family)